MLLPERISIDIKHSDYQKLAYKREVALTKGALEASSEDYVAAEISHNGKKIKAKLRLKGDLVDQLRGDKWPFRIAIKGDNTLFGMKRFSLHIPEARQFLPEWLLLRAVKEEGLVALRYGFIDVTINGKNLGIYAFEEHFEKRLIENSQRREGPIIGFSEEIDIGKLVDRAGSGKRGDFQAEKVNLYRQSKTLEDPILKQQFHRAKNLLEAFRNGDATTSQVFDSSLLAKYCAIVDLFGARHAVKYGNLKFYYNPVTSKLEPIMYDSEDGESRLSVGRKRFFAESWYVNKEQVWPLFFKDYQFFENYVRELERISDKAYLDSFFSKIENDLEKNLRIIYRSYPWYSFDRSYLYDNQNYITKLLKERRSISAYYNGIKKRDGSQFIEIKVGNLKVIPVEILSLQVGSLQLPLKNSRVILDPRFPSEIARKKIVEFQWPKDLTWENTFPERLQLTYAFIGSSQIKSEQVTGWEDYDPSFTRKDVFFQKDNVKSFQFLRIDENQKKIIVKPGNWTIDRNLILPKGYAIECGNQTSLDITKSATIISYSPLRFVGEKNHPVTIHSSDRTGQGIVVLNANEKSLIEHVVFKNLTNPSQQGWTLTGAVNFYESSVDILFSKFLDNQAEDSLNIIRSDFLIEHSVFENATSDAFDSDFSQGTIQHTLFLNSHNDAVDVSGSSVSLNNIAINGAGDKAVSVGEKSEIIATDLEINNVQIAIGSKDTSEITIENIKVSDTEIGFAVYQKKSEFGPATVSANSFRSSNVKTLHLIEEGSSLTLNGEKISATQKNVASRLYSNAK